MGMVFKCLGKYDLAMDYLNKSYEQSKEKNHKVLILSGLGQVHQNLGR